MATLAGLEPPKSASVNVEVVGDCTIVDQGTNTREVVVRDVSGASPPASPRQPTRARTHQGPAMHHALAPLHAVQP
jgi:hypothetical protein